MKQIIELNEQNGQLLIRIAGESRHWYSAYTINQWIDRRNTLGHNITNKEYVRACSRKQIDGRTGQVHKLPDGWMAAKHKNAARIYIYKRQPVSAMPQEKSKRKIIPWDSVKVNDDLVGCLRSYKYATIVHGQPVKVEVIFHPDDSYNCRSVDNIMQNKKVSQLGLAFVLAWQMELAGAWRKNIKVKAEIQRRFYEFFHFTPEGQERVDDFQKRCLWCGAYKPKNMRLDARFCEDAHRVYFGQWKKDVITKYCTATKIKKFVPSEHAQNPWLPELLDHDLVENAISNRLREIEVNLT